ncbi:DUF2637 domain-containing protein [Streptomyces roseoverticillatus]|nr:DUF2637 domain-containing protein [Streptomyces roseoverticillatus]MCF3104505.1 DUF2637 domain-containing protein [Streptomyces roseoverticillatus]
MLITVLASGLTMVLTAIAFWLSYEHLQGVAAGHGLRQATARSWAWPATVDLFIVVGELLILRASLTRRVDLWAISLATAGSGGSIALNVAGVGAGAVPLDYVVAAVPPVAALLAFGALMRQVHAYLARRAHPVAGRDVTGVETAPTPVTLTRTTASDPAPPAPEEHLWAPLDWGPADTGVGPGATPVDLALDAGTADAPQEEQEEVQAALELPSPPEPVTPASTPVEPVMEPVETRPTPVELCPPVLYRSRVDQLIRALYGTDFTQPSTARMTAAMAAAGLGGSESTARTARGRVKGREPYLAAFPSALSGLPQGELA